MAYIDIVKAAEKASDFNTNLENSVRIAREL